MALKPADLAQIEESMERAVVRAFQRVGISLADDDKTDAWRRRLDYLKEQEASSRWLREQIKEKGLTATLVLVVLGLIIIIRNAPIEWLQRAGEYLGLGK